MIENETLVLAKNYTNAKRDYQNNITREPTGFTEPENIIITGDSTTRTVTLTGTVNGYYKGILNTTIVSGWTSPAHDNITTNTYFLMYDGDSIAWESTATLSIDFYSNLLIAIAFYNGISWIYQRECHGVMPWQIHREEHNVIGTYRQLGGDIEDYISNSTTAINRRPSISSALIYDEDCATTNPVLPSGTYTQFYLSGSEVINFNTTASDIVPLNVNHPYWNQYVGGVWQQTPMDNNYYMSVWVLAVPVAADANSQKMRYIFIQGQSQHLNEEDELSVTTAEVAAGAISALTPESIFIGRIVIHYTGGNWVISTVESVSGTRYLQSNTPQENHLSTITTDDSLTGLGTVSSPLSAASQGLVGFELSSDPADPSEGRYVLWQSDGTGTGDDGDVLIKITAGGVTKTATLVDFSAI